MNIDDYNSSVAKEEGLKESITVAQVAEVHRIDNERTEGLFYRIIRGIPEKPRQYLIWSNEHKMWWRADHNGYTEDMLEAGVYEEDEATRICIGADRHQTGTFVPNEAMVPAFIQPVTNPQSGS